MDVHKPKPVRSWRELLTEVGVIVLSVCIALAAEQAVEWVHWRGQVAEAKQVIASEMARNISFGIERARFARCGQVRLRAIETILDTASRQGALPPLGQLGTAVTRPWSSGAWDSVVASQAATHFPRAQLASLSLIYKQVQRVENWNRQEIDAWAILRTMTGPGRHFDPPYEAELRKQVALARSYNNAVAVSSQRLIQNALRQGLPFTQDEQKLMADAVKGQKFAYLCGPIEAASDRAGSEMPEQTISDVEDAVKHMPQWTGTN